MVAGCRWTRPKPVGYAGEMTENTTQPGVASHSFAAHSAAAVRFVPLAESSMERRSTRAGGGASPEPPLFASSTASAAPAGLLDAAEEEPEEEELLPYVPVFTC